MKTSVVWKDAGVECWINANNTLRIYRDHHERMRWSCDAHLKQVVVLAYQDYVSEMGKCASPSEVIDVSLWFVCLARRLFETPTFIRSHIGLLADRMDAKRMAHDPRIVKLMCSYMIDTGLYYQLMEESPPAPEKPAVPQSICRDMVFRASRMAYNQEFIEEHMYDAGPPISIFYNTPYGGMED